MQIISQETWDNMPKKEKDWIIKEYNSDAGEGHSMLFKLFGKKNLQPQLTYEDVARELFKDGAWQFMDGYWGSDKGEFDESANATFSMNMTSQKQAEKLLAINRLLNVAKSRNKDWKPDWENESEDKWSLCLIKNNEELRICVRTNTNSSFVYFRTEELAKQAVQILGEDTIRLALSTDY